MKRDTRKMAMKGKKEINRREEVEEERGETLFHMRVEERDEGQGEREDV